MKRAWLTAGWLALAACRTTGSTPDEPRARVTGLELMFDEGKGDLRFELTTPGLHEPAEIHWQLQLDNKPIASGVSVVEPLAERVTVAVPVHLKGVRFDDGARRVHLLLTGDAVLVGAVLASPLSFSAQKELVLVGAPIP